MNPEPKLITRREAARLLGVSPHTLARWSSLGLLPAVKLGRRVMYALDTIRRAAEEGVKL